MPDPFEVVSAENMDLRQVATEFVPEHTEHAKLASHSHTLVSGSRGSGKSMHLRYLEPVVQAERTSLTGATRGDTAQVLADPNGCLGVYINCRDGALNRNTLRHAATLPNVDGRALALVLERYLAAAVVDRFCNTINEQVPSLRDKAVVPDGMPVWLRQVCAESVTCLGHVFDTLRPTCAKWLFSISTMVDGFYQDISRPADLSSCPKDTPNLTVDVVDFCKWFRAVTQMRAPVFLMFDEANELSEIHQFCINSLIALRTQKFLCVKVASQKKGYTTGRTLSSDVDETHDYTTVDLDGLYTNNCDNYYERLKSIANRRLAKVCIATEVADYLPRNETEVKAMVEARRLAEKKYMALADNERPNDMANFIKKYAPSIMFQEVLPAKGRVTYAGFDNIVHLSSGIVRSFLDCCSKMYTTFSEGNPGKEPTFIPVGIQGTVIMDYSDDFIQKQIVDKIAGLSGDPHKRDQFDKLHCLLKGMGKLFRERLMDKNSREPRIISISLKDEPSGDLADVLTLAEAEAFLHTRWYRSKRGDRNLKCYILNRRLCPHFNLDLTGFQGRVEVTAEELAVSLSKPDQFAASVLNRRQVEEDSENSKQLVLFEL